MAIQRRKSVVIIKIKLERSQDKKRAAILAALFLAPAAAIRSRHTELRRVEFGAAAAWTLRPPQFYYNAYDFSCQAKFVAFWVYIF